MHGYSVREYAFLSVIYNGCPKSSLDHAYIPQTAFEYLCGLAASFSKSGAKIFEIAGRKKLKLDQYVGVIETPCGTRIEILPKHVEFKNDGENDEEYQHKVIQKERELLQKMLSVSLHLKARNAGEASLKQFKKPLHEWIIHQFLKALELLVQQGLRFEYNRIQEEQKFLKGQLQHVKYMRQPPSKKHIFPIEHDVYEVNRPENRLIKTALEIICKKTKDSANWKLAQELRLMTNEIPKSYAIQQDFKKWQSNRLLALYHDIKPWTELVLGEYMPVATQGDWRGISLLFPMEKLFEHYVAYYLRRELKDWDIKTQVASQYICTHHEKPMFRLRPDIYIKHKHLDNKIVLDTKWKLINQNHHSERFGIKDSDIQQMFAYSHFYLGHASDVILIYPYLSETFNEPLSDFHIKDSSAKIRVIPFELDHPERIISYLNI